MFSKKASKIDVIFTIDLTLHNVKSTVKILSILVAFLENMSIKLKSRVLIKIGYHIVPSPFIALDNSQTLLTPHNVY